MNQCEKMLEPNPTQVVDDVIAVVVVVIAVVVVVGLPILEKD